MTAISKLYSKLLDIGHEIEPNKEVLVTDGAYEALFTGIQGGGGYIYLPIGTSLFNKNGETCSASSQTKQLELN